MSHCPSCDGDHLPNEEEEDKWRCPYTVVNCGSKREALEERITLLLETIDVQCKLLLHNLVVEMRSKAENKVLAAKIAELEKG